MSCRLARRAHRQSEVAGVVEEAKVGHRRCRGHGLTWIRVRSDGQYGTPVFVDIPAVVLVRQAVRLDRQDWRSVAGNALRGINARLQARRIENLPVVTQIRIFRRAGAVVGRSTAIDDCHRGPVDGLSERTTATVDGVVTTQRRIAGGDAPIVLRIADHFFEVGARIDQDVR